MHRIRITTRVFLRSLWLLVLLASSHISAQQLPPLKVVLLAYPGYAEYDAQGQVVGRTVDLLDRLFERAELDYEIELLPIARVRRGLVSGDVDLWLGLNNQVGLEAYAIQSLSSFGSVPIHLYYRPGEPAPTWPDSLQGKALILITNYNYSLPVSRVLQDPRLAIELRSSSSHVGAIRMLMRNRGDYLLDYRGQTASAMAELNLDQLPYIVVDDPPMRLFASRSRPDAAVLINRLDGAFDSLVAEGVNMTISRQ